MSHHANGNGVPKVIFSGFFAELKSQCVELARLVRTRDFWIYVAVVALFCLLAFAGMRMAMGFDPLTRGWVGMNLTCRTGEGQLATIIVGSFVFAMACLFTLGEVVNWVEETRMSRAPGRHMYPVGYWRPLLHVIGTVCVGVGGFSLMRMWCT